MQVPEKNEENYLHDENQAGRSALDNISESEIQIPIGIFRGELGSFETITKYLRDNYGLRNCDIARLTGRHEKSVWGTYHNASIKCQQTVVAGSSYSAITIPLSVILDRNLGVLEAISFYLKEKLSLKYSQIANLIHRDQRTVWTAVFRAKKKLAGAVTA